MCVYLCSSLLFQYLSIKEIDIRKMSDCLISPLPTKNVLFWSATLPYFGMFSRQHMVIQRDQSKSLYLIHTSLDNHVLSQHPHAQVTITHKAFIWEKFETDGGSYILPFTKTILFLMKKIKWSSIILAYKDLMYRDKHYWNVDMLQYMHIFIYIFCFIHLTLSPCHSSHLSQLSW